MKRTNIVTKDGAEVLKIARRKGRVCPCDLHVVESGRSLRSILKGLLRSGHLYRDGFRESNGIQTVYRPTAR